MDSIHIAKSRLTDVVLKQQPLPKDEREHLVNCFDCQEDMLQSTRIALESEPDFTVDRHITDSRLVANMLHLLPLNEEASDHLARCATCHRQMVEATKKALGKDLK